MKVSPFIWRIHTSTTWTNFPGWRARAAFTARIRGLMNDVCLVAVFSVPPDGELQPFVMREAGWPQILRQEPSGFRLIPNAREAVFFAPHAQCEIADHCG